MARFKRARRFIARQRKGYKKAYRKRPVMAGMTANVFSGAAIGVGTRVLSPYINQYVPSVMNMQPTTIALLGGGIVAKGFLHKGGKLADAAIIIGSAQAASQLVGSYMGGSSASTGVQSY